MNTVHFLELREYAVRGQIERGRRYLVCHSHIGGKNPTAQAHEILTLSRVQSLPRRTFIRDKVETGDPYWEQREDMFLYTSTRYRFNPRWQFACDVGLWEFGDYKNSFNYLLHIGALLREGIKIDTTLVPVAPDEDDYWMMDEED